MPAREPAKRLQQPRFHQPGPFLWAIPTREFGGALTRPTRSGGEHRRTSLGEIANQAGEAAGDRLQKIAKIAAISMRSGGEGGIRTHGTVTRTTVFETVPFDHSGTSPARRL